MYISSNTNLRGEGPTEDKKDNPATRLYVLCQALTPIGLNTDSLTLQPVALPSRNLQQVITHLLLRSTTGVNEQFPGRDSNPLDSSPMTACDLTLCFSGDGVK